MTTNTICLWYDSDAAGISMATYEPAGGVATGSFAMETPTEQELARHWRIKAEG
jgi:hypothetical protein